MSDSPNVPFNWNDYLTLAEDLSRRSDEAARRSAISRAYYAAYNLARQHLRDALGANVGPASEPIPPSGKRKGEHEWCWDKFCDSGHDGCIDIGELGKRLKGFRVEADYEANSAVARNAQGTDMVIQRAKTFIEKIEDLDPDYPKKPVAQIVSATPKLGPPKR
jgi:hypothetical protein